METYALLKLIWTGILGVLFIGLGTMVGMDMGVGVRCCASWGAMMGSVGRRSISSGHTGTAIRYGSFWVEVRFSRRFQHCMARRFLSSMLS